MPGLGCTVRPMALLTIPSVTVVSGSYPGAPQAQCGFKPDWWMFNVQSTSTPTDDLFVSFDGTNDHLYLTAGSQAALGGIAIWNKSKAVWLRWANSGDAIPVSVMAGTRS